MDINANLIAKSEDDITTSVNNDELLLFPSIER